MITFYKADETDFDNNGLGVLDHDIQNPDIEEKLNDIFTFSFNYPIFAVNGSRLAARMIVKADDPENEGQLFRIMKLSKSNGMLTAFCYHIFYDLNGNEIPDTNIVGQNGQTAITQMLSKTAVAHKFQGFSDIAETANIRVVRMSPVKFLIDPQTDNNFINRLGGEIRRVNYRIWMNKVRGSDNGATIRWKKSLDSYNATWDYTTIATRIRPVGYNGIMLPESYVDSPLIDKYETIVIKEIQYSDIKAIDPNATSNDETAVPLEQAYELLRQAAAKEFSGNNLDKPTVTLSVNMVALRNMDEYKDVESLETINPWDTVTVINERDGLSVKVRLNHYHWNPVTHKFISMELGNAKSTFTDISSKVDHATNLANQANDTANTAAESANGKNSNYYGSAKPANPVDGDLWYKKNGDKTELWQYDGKSVPPGWKLVVDDVTGEEVRQNVDAAQKAAEEAKNQANKAVDGANDAVSKAGFANDTATQAKSDAAAAGQQAKDALTGAQKALTNSSSAQADSAQARKDSATAIKDAADSLTSAKDAISKVGTLTTSVTSQFTTVDNELKSKVNQTDYDKLKGTVTSQQTDISQNANSIKLKADKSYADTINNSVVKNTSSVGLLNDQIALTVSKTELTSKLNGYATQTWSEGKISAAKDEIKASVETVKQTVDNWRVGGTNLAPGTSADWQKVSVLSGWGTTYLSNKVYEIKDGETYTLQVEVRNITSPIMLEPYCYTAAGAGDGLLAPAQEADKDGKIIITFTANLPEGYAYFRPDLAFTSSLTGAGSYEYRRFKLETGTMATDWSPTPEDQATVDWTKSQLDITDKKITAGITTVTNTLNNNIASATANMATTTWTNTQIDAAKTVINLSVEQSITTTKNTLNNNIANATNDMATKTWTKGQLDLTDSSLTSQISSVKDGLTTQYTQLQQTLNGVQITANNAVTQGQLTLLSDQFTSTISGVKADLNNMNVGGRNLIHDTSFEQGLWKTAFGNPSFEVTNDGNLKFSINDTEQNGVGAPLEPLEMLKQYTLTAKVRGHGPFMPYIMYNEIGNLSLYDDYGVTYPMIDSATEFVEIKYTFTLRSRDTTKQGVFAVLTAETVGNWLEIKKDSLKLEAGNVSTAWTPAPEDQATVADVSSQFTQLQSDINLRVKTGDLINQINISPEGILIDGKKVHITGQTRIDNAVIKDAMIADIKADKITAGTLNAANVNVINLNANNITTGTIKGANLSMNLNTGEVVFQHGRIHSTSNNVDINVDEGYLSTASGDTRVMLKEGQLQLVQPTIFDNSKDPYLEISNSVGGASFNGANIIARDYLVLANRANAGGYFNNPIGQETFAGLAVGKSDYGGWHETRLGGADRGVIITGGKAFNLSSVSVLDKTPAIRVGSMDPSRSDRISIEGSYVHIPSAYWRTASGGPNVIVAKDGALVRSTSASKYKTDIIRTNIPDYGDKLLNLPTATWTDIAETKRYQDNPTTQPKPTRNFGMIAEDLADAGLEMLVVRGTDGELEGINYDRIGPALIPVIAKLKNKIEKLEQKLEEKTA